MNRFMIIWLIGLAACSNPAVKSNLFDSGKNTGTVSKELEEASGIVASINNPGYLWSHNDSGNPTEVFLLDQKADIVFTILLKGITNRDFEAIAVGPGPEEGKNYIYLGDIGDNLAVYPEKLIYRFEEPVLVNEKKLQVDQFDTLIVKLSDQIRDTEAMMVDPVSKELIIVSKREDSVRLYRSTIPSKSDTTILQYAFTMPFHKVVAADVSRDGSEVLLKDYEHVYYWKKKGNESIFDLLQTPATELTYTQEPQGEAICWAVDGTGFYTLSETVKEQRGKLLYYKRK